MPLGAMRKPHFQGLDAKGKPKHSKVVDHFKHLALARPKAQGTTSSPVVPKTRKPRVKKVKA